MLATLGEGSGSEESRPSGKKEEAVAPNSLGFEGVDRNSNDVDTSKITQASGGAATNNGSVEEIGRNNMP